MKATVFGASGFVGSHLAQHLETQGFDCMRLPRGDESWRERDLGHVFYCIGLTADFRKRPLDTIEAHVEIISRILKQGRFDSLLYLSSTRVYLGAAGTQEDTVLQANPNKPDDLYNLSKLMGEAACLSHPNPAVRVARLSNVYGAGMDATNFLGSLINDALEAGRITLGTASDSEKDYVSIEAVIPALTRIALFGPDRLYNVASGHNTMHQEIVDRIAQHTQCTVQILPGAPTIKFPKIDIARLRNVNRASSSNVITDLDALIEDARRTRAYKA
jgi:nucleoside-diphosphate-sugar epimerase